MYYRSFIKRFLFRNNFVSRVKMRLSIEKRKLVKNEFDDLSFLYEVLGEKPEAIFDCGANVGYVSYQFHRRFRTSRVYAFEPNPSVYDQLVCNLEKEKSTIKPFNVGISNSSGTLEFYKNNNTGTSSFFEPNDFHKAHLARRYQKIDVPIISIGDFCNQNSVDAISILKLDIEGFELKALEGCEELLRNQAIDFVYAEVNLVPTYDDQPLLEDIISYLRKFDYIPYNFYGNNETNLRESIITNILFMSNKVARAITEKKGTNSVYLKK
ncbi:2-O-methyltransferase NoeI [compost metagenome]